MPTAIPARKPTAEEHTPEAERQRALASEADARAPEHAERHRRLTLEGLADVDAGQLIEDEAMREWADSLGTDRELPPPDPD